MAFLDKLDSLMAQQGINKNQLSQSTGVPYSTIDSFYKKGSDNIKLSTLRKLADYFGCSLDYLVDDDMMEDEVKEQNELTEYLDDLHKRPELKTLFSLTKNATKEDVEKAIKIIEMFKETSI